MEMIMALKVIDRFTTRDGKWEVDNRPYGLTKEALDKYGSLDIPGKGGASHIFVKAKPGDIVHFNTSDDKNRNSVITDGKGWANFPMWKTSAHWPPNVGPWKVDVGNVNVASGLGLPEGLHVSTFLIVEDEDVDEGSQPEPPILVPGETQDRIQVIVNGVMVFDNWSEQ
jgi:hypothetical protein